MTLAQRLNASPFVGHIRAAYMTPWYPTIVTCLMVLSFTRALEYPMWTILAVLACISLILCDNMVVLMPPTFCATFFIATSNAPGNVSHSGELFASHNLPWLFALAFVIVVCFVLHIVIYGSWQALKGKPKLLLYFSLPMVLAIFLNGIGNPNRAEQDSIFPWILTLCWVGFYLIYAWGVTPSQESREYFFLTCFCVAVGLVAQLLYVYLIKDAFLDGRVFFGWGLYNNYGGIMALLIPPIFYLSATRRYGWCYYLFGLVAWAAIFFSTSRSSLLVGTLILGACLVAVCFHNPHKKLYRIFLGALALLALGVLLLYPELIDKLVPRYGNVGWSDSGRFKIWKGCVDLFLEYPIFGGGFFAIPFTSYIHPDGAYKFMPGFAHNTIFELMGAGGILLFVTYLVYRGATIWRLIRKMNLTRVFLGLTILAILGTSMLDNHLFNIYPAFFYAAALALGEQDALETLGKKEAPLCK